jgi:hypothetical protein
VQVLHFCLAAAAAVGTGTAAAAAVTVTAGAYEGYHLSAAFFYSLLTRSLLQCESVRMRSVERKCLEDEEQQATCMSAAAVG